mgnify:CR=1 FL=1
MSDVDIEGAMGALEAELPDEMEGNAVGDSTGVEDHQVEPESFTKFNPNDLPEELQPFYRSMQADYTKKTQEIAEIRRQQSAFSDSGVDPKDALEAAQFFATLDSDPYAAAEFVQNMQARLEQMGIGQQVSEDFAPDNVGYEGLPPELAQEIEAMREFRAEMVMQQQQQEIIAELEVAENTIKVANPDYTDDDMEAIYSLAYATDGDLMAAQQQYHAIQQRLLGNYLQAKSVPHGATPAPNGPNSVPHRDFNSLDEAHKAAMEAVRNIS